MRFAKNQPQTVKKFNTQPVIHIICRGLIYQARNFDYSQEFDLLNPNYRAKDHQSLV